MNYPGTSGERPNGTLISTQKVYYTNGVIWPGLCGAARGIPERWDNPITFIDIEDGLSNTFLFGEKHIQISELGKQGFSGGVPHGDASIFSTEGPNNYVRAGGPGLPLARAPGEPPGPIRPWSLIFGSYHPGVCQFTMSDGSVRAVSNLINTTTLGQLCNRKDGIPLPGNF